MNHERLLQEHDSKNRDVRVHDQRGVGERLLQEHDSSNRDVRVHDQRGVGERLLLLAALRA